MYAGSLHNGRHLLLCAGHSACCVIVSGSLPCMENPRPKLHHRRESLVLSYSNYIKSCFRRQHEAAPYYKQLLDFLDPGAAHGSSSLQKPRYFDLPKSLRRSSDHAARDDSGDRARNAQPRIAVLEGFPSPESISAIGANERVRPEVFIGHLDFSCSSTFSPEFYELPSLPSDRQNIVHIRLMTMGRTMPGDSRLKSQAENRLKANKRCTAFERRLFEGKQYGATRFRKVHLHSSQVFTVEQMVSFSVSKSGPEPWCGEFGISMRENVAHICVRSLFARSR